MSFPLLLRNHISGICSLCLGWHLCKIQLGRVRLIIFLHKYRWRYTDVGNDAGACTCMRLLCLYCASTASSCSHNFLPQMMHRSHSQKQTAGRWPNYAPQTIEPCTCLSSVTPLFRMLCVYLELWLCRIQYQ